MMMNKGALFPGPNMIRVPTLPAAAGIPKSPGWPAWSAHLQLSPAPSAISATVEIRADGPVPHGDAYLTLLRLWSGALGGAGLIGGRTERAHLGAIATMVMTCSSRRPGAPGGDDPAPLVLDHRERPGTAPWPLRRPWPADRLIVIPADLLESCRWQTGGRWSPLLGHLLVFIWARCCRARRPSLVPGDKILYLISPPAPWLEAPEATRHAEFAARRLRSGLERLQVITGGQVPARWASAPIGRRRRGRPPASWALAVEPGIGDLAKNWHRG